MQQNINKPQYQDLGQIQLNQNGRPKQAVILYQLTSQMIKHAKQQISKDINYLSQNKYKQVQQKSAKVWDNFYSSHKCNFFKDRNYLQRQIKEIAYFRQKYHKDKQEKEKQANNNQKQQKQVQNNQKQQKQVQNKQKQQRQQRQQRQQQNSKYIFLQLGCGVGNTLFPLLRQYNFFNYQGCDISAQAIKLIQNQMQQHPQFKHRLQVKVCDLVKDQIPFETKPDLLSMIFVLSAIVPQKHQQVINKIAKWMKPGSCFFFRDYGRYDFGQVNMSNKGNRKLKDNFYVKHDGVCVYYFEQEQLQKLFENAGLIKVEGSIHCRLLQNRKTGLKMYRIWVQGRFYKPPISQFFKQKIKLQEQQTKSKLIQRQTQQKMQKKQQQKYKQQKQIKQQKQLKQQKQGNQQKKNILFVQQKIIIKEKEQDQQRIKNIQQKRI